jgi:hypothetical protein
MDRGEERFLLMAIGIWRELVFTRGYFVEIVIIEKVYA